MGTRDEPGVTQDGPNVWGRRITWSPEQARGESDVTARRDIYSLGGILFCVVDGAPPHRA